MVNGRYHNTTIAERKVVVGLGKCDYHSSELPFARQIVRECLGEPPSVPFLISGTKAWRFLVVLNAYRNIKTSHLDSSTVEENND